MTLLLSRTLREGCLSDFAIDELLADRTETPHAHLQECAECMGRLQAFKAEREEPLPALLATAAPREKKAPSSPWWHTWFPAGVGLAVAAAALLFYVSDSGSLATRTKGPARLGFFIEHGGVVREGSANEVVHPGDALQFHHTSSQDTYFAVLSVDGAGVASIYYPEGRRTSKVLAGHNVIVQQSTVLDGTLGPETLYGLFCTRPIDLEPVRQHLATTAQPPNGCTWDVVRIAKSEIP